MQPLWRTRSLVNVALWPSAKASAPHSYLIFAWMDVATVTCVFPQSLAAFLHVSVLGQHWSLLRTISQRRTKLFDDAVKWCTSSKVSTGNVSINDHCFSSSLGLRFFLSLQCVPADRRCYVFKTHPFPSPKYSPCICIGGQNNGLRAFPFMHSWRWAEPSPPTHFHYLTHVPASSCM